MRLPRTFYRRGAIEVACGLLGQRLVHRVDGVRLAGIIVETEAYLGPLDAASHAYRGRRTKRTEVMYHEGGTVYIYLNYGLHHMLNVVASSIDDPQAVLIRAIEPTEGIEQMQLRRPKATLLTQISSGPGKLGAAFAIRREHNGIDLATSDLLFVEQTSSISDHEIVTTSRIGIDYANEWIDKPLRYYVRGNAHVSVP